jgi:hypothetical protein
VWCGMLTGLVKEGSGGFWRVVGCRDGRCQTGRSSGEEWGTKDCAETTAKRVKVVQTIGLERGPSNTTGKVIDADTKGSAKPASADIACSISNSIARDPSTEEIVSIPERKCGRIPVSSVKQLKKRVRHHGGVVFTIN